MTDLSQRLHDTQQELEQARQRIAQLESQLEQSSGLSSPALSKHDYYEAIHSSLELYRTLIENSDTAVSLIDRCGQIIYLNRVFASNFNSQPEQCVGKSLQDLLPTAQAQIILPAIEQVINTNRSMIREIELPIRGQSHWFRVSIQPVHDSTNQVYAALLNTTDITTAKQIEISLQQQNELLRQSHDLIAIADIAGHITYINRGGADLVGATSTEQLIGKTIRDFHPPDDAARIVNDILPLTIQTGYWRGQTQIKTLSGHLIDVDQTIFPLRNPDGSIVAYATIMTDITERKQAEESFRKSENYLRSLVDSQTTYSMRVDMLGNIVYCNDRYLEQFGKEGQSPIGTSSLNGIHPDDHETVLNVVSNCLTHAGIPIQVELRKPVRTGDYIWTLWEFIAVQGDDGNISEIQCVGFDISKQKQAEAELYATNERLEQRVTERTAELESTSLRLQAIFNHSADGILLLDSDRRIQQANFSFESLFGLTGSDYQGINLEKFVAENVVPTIQTSIQEILATHETRTIETLAKRADGTLFDAELSIAPVNRSTMPISNMVCIVRDISQRKRAEQSLAEERNLLRTVIDLLPDYIFVKDLQHRMVLNNLAHARVLGAQHPREVQGKTDYDIFPLEVAAKFYADEAEVFRTEKPLIGKEERTIGVNGSNIWALTTKIPFRNLQGELVGLVGITHDISEIKNNEEALHRSEQQLQESQKILQMVLDTIPVSVYWKNRELVYLGCNRFFAKDIGLQHPSEIIGKSDMDLPIPKDYTDERRIIDNFVIQTGSPKLEYEQKRSSATGNTNYLQTNALPLRDDADNVIGVLVSYIDITDRKQAADLLRESEERLRILFETVPDAICLTTLDGTFVDVNSAALRITGLSREQLIGQNIMRINLFNKPIYRQQAEQGLALTRQGDTRVIEYEIIDVNSNPVYIEAISHPITLHNERLQLAIIRDITNRRKAEEALRASEELYRSTITAMNEGIVMQNADGSIEFCNTAAEIILGLTADQMTGRTSADPRWRAVHENGLPFPGNTHPAMMALNTGNPQSNVVMGVHKSDGNLTWILINAQPLFDTDSEKPYAVVTTFADITKRKNAEEALERALEQEKELGELKSRFVSMASHEFRTPLATILATAETLSVYRTKMTQEQIDARLEKIRQQVLHMKDILDDVLQLARIQAGRVEFRPMQGDLNELCSEIIQEFEDQRLYQGRIIAEYPRVPLPVVYDERLMRHIVSNIISNALKYSTSDKQVYVSLTQQGKNAVFTVRDEGIGIPEHDQKHLYEPFHRATNVGTISGTGLGLSITKQAVELHGGAISLRSGVGQGTTFTVIIPIIPPNRIA